MAVLHAQLSRYIPILAATGLLVTGCATRSSRPPESHAPPQALVAAYDGLASNPVPWDVVVANASAADVVIMGEQHDDDAGHQIQLALLERLLACSPRTALSLEMLDRDDTHILREYMNGRISTGAFISKTNAAAWGDEETWRARYQPLIDAAREAHASVIPANAPRRLVTEVRENGFESIATLGTLDRTMVALPTDGLNFDAYRQHFSDTMSGHGGEGMPPLDDETIAKYFRAQQTWDATMADSVARAVPQSRPVVLMVGQFHTDFEGGLVRELRHRAPHATILVLSLVPENDEDADTPGRADYVLITKASEEEGEEN